MNSAITASQRHSTMPYVAHVVGNLKGGGAERVVVDLIRGWRDHRYRPALILAKADGDFLGLVPDATALEVIGCSTGITDAATFGRRFNRALSRLDPVAVISHCTDMNRAVLRSAMLGGSRVPITIVEHGNLEYRPAHQRRSAVREAAVGIECRVLYRRAHALIGVSVGVARQAQRLFRLPPVRVHSVPNPVDVESIRKMTETQPPEAFAHAYRALRPPVILAVGRLELVKGFADLIAAFAMLPAHVRGSLVILGSGALKHDLERLAARNGIASDVHLPGFTANPWWYMARAALFVHPSHSEGFGNVIVEALACGAPVIATDCDFGPREIVQAAGAGTLVGVGDVRRLSVELARAAATRPPSHATRDQTAQYLAGLSPSRISQRYLSVAVGPRGGI